MKAYLLILLLVFFVPGPAFGDSMLKLPLLPSPEQYGSILMEGHTKEKGVSPVTFSHWRHRTKYTCKVCHFEIEFAMKVNDTPIVCDNGQMGGEYCAKCHDGKISFGPKDETGENCDRCHNAYSSSGWKEFQSLQDKLPKSRFGNEIDWTKALNEGLINPKDSLSGSSRKPLKMKTLTLKAEMGRISPAIFPHSTHEQWLDCSSCHPELFNIKKKSTESLRMNNMIKGGSCGVCHLSVAFPLDDCKRCHPAMKVF